MKRAYAVLWVSLLLVGVCNGDTISSNGTGGGKWSAAATWAGGLVPADGHSVTIVAGDTVTFDVDTSGWAHGIAGLTCNGTMQCSTGPGKYHLKTSADIGGTGSILCGSAGAAYPPVCTMTFDFDSKPNSFECGSGLVLKLFCAQPTYPVLISLVDAAAGQKGLTADKDVTKDIWAAGNTVRIDDASGSLPDSEAGVIGAGGITSSGVTLQAGLAKAKGPGAQIVLVTRNIRLIGSTDWAVKFMAGGVLGCEISNCSNGINGSFAGVVSGVISGCAYAASSCQTYAVPGVISGCTYGVNGSAGSTVSGVVTGCTYGVSWCPECLVLGVVSGCGSGVYASSGRLQGAILRGNAYDLRRVPSATAYNTAFSGTTENLEYNTERVPPWGYVASYDHDGVPGDFKAWTRGGVVVLDVNTVPEGYTSSYRHMCKNGATPCFRQEATVVQPGQTLSVEADLLVLEDHSAWAPRLEIIDAGADPLVDATKVALSSALMPQPKSRYAWQHVVAAYTNTGTLGKPVLIRCSAQRSTGDVYEVWTTLVTP